MRGKRILVTGATGPLGVALVEAFWAMGGEVVAAAWRRTELDDLRASLCHHDRLHTAEVDLCDPDGVQALVAALERVGALDLVLHAAGEALHRPLWELEVPQLRRLLDAGPWSAALLARAVLAPMRARGRGTLILVGPDPALPAPAPDLACAHGLAGLALGLARELRGSGVRAHALLVGAGSVVGAADAAPLDPPAVARAALRLASDPGAPELLRLPAPEPGEFEAR